MTVEEKIFKKKKLRPETLEPFGFRKTGGAWKYSRAIMNGDFRAEVTVSEDGSVSGRVVDVALDEEYLPLHIESRTGAFVGQVREEYEAVLADIAAACFSDRLFAYDQSNRIAELIEQRYGERPDFPFSTAPDYGVFRYPQNRKWYGLLMNIRMHQLTASPPTGDDPVVEVLNLKTEELEKLLAVPGIYPGYHMRNKSWISVILDGTVPDGLVMELVDKSRAWAISKTAKKKKR